MTDDPRSLPALLGELYSREQRALAAAHARFVPFGDLVYDRWARATLMGFGEGTSIYDSSLVIGDVSVGRQTWIGPFTVLDGSGGLTIGSTCSISAGVQIYSHDSVAWAVSGGKAAYERAPVSIGDHTYIGPMTIVTKGVSIGRHCVIGANSVVNKDVPDFAIAYGSTARVVGRVLLSAAGTVSFEYDPAPGDASG
jgi:acetyltransferase-like isoleucine patch superfamily enzyme